MNEKEVIEGNRTIAKKMGYELITPEMRKNPSKWYVKGVPSCYWERIDKKGRKRVLGLDGRLMYHRSWEWLMPVVAKLSWECEEPDELDPLKYALFSDNIEQAWKFIVSHWSE